MLMFSIFCPLLCGTQIKDIQQHLKVCKNKHLLNKYYFQCPYHPNHILSKKSFPSHLENCPNKKQITEIENVENSELDKLTKKESLSKYNSKPKKEIKLKLNVLEKKKDKKLIEKLNTNNDLSLDKSTNNDLSLDKSTNDDNLSFDIFKKNKHLKQFEERKGSFYSENTEPSYDNSFRSVKNPYHKKISFDKKVKVFVYEKELLYTSRFQRKYQKKNDEDFIKTYNKNI